MFYLIREEKIKRVMGKGSELGGEGVEEGWLVVGRVLVFLMKIISWNVRGLGSFEKRREVSQLVREKCPFILSIQESKCVNFDDIMCQSI